MSGSTIQILFIADIVGSVGFQAFAKSLGHLKEISKADFVIVNGENCAEGKGITPRIVQDLFDLGVHAITSGNHIWNRQKILEVLEQNPYVLRPLNYPEKVPGHGTCTLSTPFGRSLAVVSLQGRSFMYPIDCPFRAMDREIQRLRGEGVHGIVVDFHAEATAEKIALGWYLDGKVSAVIGTHTHVQTADEQILTQGTAYITDVGMTGPFDSVIGMDKETAIRRFLTQLPLPYQIASKNVKVCGVTLSIDPDTGKALSISRFQHEPN